MYKPDKKDFEIPNPEDIQKLQKNDALKSDDSYDIDIEEKKQQESVKEEHIDPTPPPKKEEQVFFDDIDEKYMLPDNDIPDEPVEEPPTFKDESPTRVKDGKKTEKSKEYLNRKDTIFEDPPELPKSKELAEVKKKKNSIAKAQPQKKKASPIQTQEEANTYSNIVTFFAVIFFVALVVFFFAILMRLSSNKTNLSEAEKLQVIEMSTFLSYNEEFVSGINELSDQKKLLLESYIKGTRNKEELFLELLAIDKKEQSIIDLFNENSWTFESVNNLNNMTYDFLSSNKQNTKDLLDQLHSNPEKSKILQIYNDGVAYHESQIYTINQYAKQEVDKLGVDTLIEGNAIQIDLTKVR